jgi:hypothetical protein
MSFKPPPGIIRGRMTDAEKKRIDEIAARMRDPKPSPIAHKINRHPATVTWYMLTKGLLVREPGYAPAPYERNGKMIFPYSPEQDAMLVELRTKGLSKKLIARSLTEKFGIERNHHSVDVRLVQLAAAPADKESGER